MDGTLSRSRMPVLPSMAKLLKKLAKEHDVIVVSGSVSPALIERMTPALKGHFYTLGQNGNSAVGKKGERLWENKLNWEQRHEILSYVRKIVDKRLHDFRDVHDLVEDKGGQITYSLIGVNEKIDIKEAFDPDFEKRKKVLSKHPFQSETIDVKIAGTTGFDFFHKGSNKGTNVKKLMKLLGWKKGDAVYVGDCLFPGGNDETVVGVIPTHAVENPKDTETFIESLLKKKA